jgi:heme O synthase-like polyprenyltransferase
MYKENGNVVIQIFLYYLREVLLSLLIVYSGYLIIIGNEIKTTGYIVYSMYLIRELNKQNRKHCLFNLSNIKIK